MIKTRAYTILWVIVSVIILSGYLIQTNGPNIFNDDMYQNISSLKLNFIFDDKNNFEYLTYFLFIGIPAWYYLNNFNKKYSHISWFFLTGLPGIILLESTILSRLAFSFGILPTIIVVYKTKLKFKYKNNIRTYDIRNILFNIFCLIVLLPGFYFPPFFDGITGWTMKSSLYNNDSEIIFTGLEAHDSNNNVVPFPFACFSPVTQEDRLLSSLLNPLEPPLGKVISNIDLKDGQREFILKNFNICFNDLKNGYFPYQKILGKFAYPTHNMSTNKDASIYNQFNVNKLEAVYYVSYHFTKNDKDVFELSNKELIYEFKLID